MSLLYLGLTFWDWIPKQEQDPDKTGSFFSQPNLWFGEMPIQTVLQFHGSTIMAKIHKNKLTINVGEVVGKGTLH